MKSKGYEFPPDDSLQEDFEAHFNYIETNSQLRCVDEIKADMMKPVPMERLLCGDVGFGKTEVALSALYLFPRPCLHGSISRPAATAWRASRSTSRFFRGIRPRRSSARYFAG